MGKISGRTFDVHTYHRLDGHDFRLLDELAYLCKLRQKHVGASYCTPSTSYLSAKLGIVRESVSRHITKLTKLGILSVTHRRKRDGTWLTNLYKIVKWEAWRIHGAIAQTLRGKKSRKESSSVNHVTLDANKPFSYTEKSLTPQTSLIFPEKTKFVGDWLKRMLQMNAQRRGDYA